jgi:alkyl sulfatase BDS1-like metallo-beta-lactamase superfamily hydrolase
VRTRLRSWLARVVGALLFTGLGLVLGRTESGREAAGVLAAGGSRAREAAVGAVATAAALDVRTRLMIERPHLARALGSGFGNEFSRSAAQNMFGRVPEAIADVREKTRVEAVAPRTWLVRMPIVNAVLFETDEGLVLVDAGMAPAGPALVDAIRSVSRARLHTLILTHGHVDHAYQPEIVAQERLPLRFERYIELRGSLAKYMSQPVEQLPRGRDDLVWPTRTFRDHLELEIGGERFVLQHHPGETDDQLYVWVPGRRVLASADYYQGFLPNAGNGKRVQRFVKEWTVALREMAALEPGILLPAHGEAITDPPTIRENLLVLAEALEWIRERTIEGLNAGLRQDRIFASIELPERLANHPSLRASYVTPQDISRMVIKEYAGWWDDIPSHWSPAPREREARALVGLAGGTEAVAAAAREALPSDARLAAHLSDRAFLADPEDPVAQALVLDVYEARILDPATPTQERLAYLDAMVAARTRQLEGATRSPAR